MCIIFLIDLHIPICTGVVLIIRNYITFAEEGCIGPGSDKSNRVKWERNLSGEDLDSFISNSYIDPVGWIRRIPLSIPAQ